MPQIQRWKNELNPATALLTATPIPGDVASTNQNNNLFNQLKDLVVQRNMVRIFYHIYNLSSWCYFIKLTWPFEFI